MFFSQSTQLKFSNLNTWSKYFADDFLAGVYFRGIKFSRIDWKIREIRENFMLHGMSALASLSK